MPFPREEITPPVTKMYLAMSDPLRLRVELAEAGLDGGHVLGTIDGEGAGVDDSDGDPDAVLERAELLEAFDLLERRPAEGAESLQERPPERVQAEVAQRGGRRPRLRRMG